MADITVPEVELDALRRAFAPLLGLRLTWLAIPTVAIGGYEPSQLAVMTNTLADGALPQVTHLAVGDPEAAQRLGSVGLSKAAGRIGEREGYPDYEHRASGHRVELKGLFVDNAALLLKRPPTAREPSARLKENVTEQVVNARRDVLLVAATQLRELDGYCAPEIVDLGLFPVIDCVRARDLRLRQSPGKWIGSVPKVLSNTGRRKLMSGLGVTDDDFEKDTNFGKLNRIPYPPLVTFLRKHGYQTPQPRAWQGPLP